MRILTVDVGTGTQDILLFDAAREIENCFKLVMPSPTVVVADRLRDATREQTPVLLRGVTMGGGPCHWAAMDHLRAGLPLLATPEAARTFDDDLDSVRAMGVEVVSEDEASAAERDGVVVVSMRDFWLEQVLETFERFGVDTSIDALAVAVFDHGAAPPGYSDRIFRFDYLRERLAGGRGLAGFAFLRDAIPAAMTRLRAVAATAPADLPLLVMDTAPAAVLGALDDPVVRAREHVVVANVGNFHCLAFHLQGGKIAGLFEHHTGEVSAARLADYIRQLAEGTISNEAVYADKGHGALVLAPDVPAPSFVAATGPRRHLLVEGGVQPYLAVPHGDMMLAGNFGLLRAFAAEDTRVHEAVTRRLGPAL